jgi:hypothetical protein
MKTLILYYKNFQILLFKTVVLTIFVFSSIQLNAQAPFADESLIAVKGNDIPPLKSIKDFSARVMENTVYLNLIMKGETGNSVFLLEKSTNGTEFIVIAQKEGYTASSGITELLYSFVDPNPGSGKFYYRVKQFRADGILYSHLVTVFIDPIPLVQNAANSMQ